MVDRLSVNDSEVVIEDMREQIATTQMAEHSTAQINDISGLTIGMKA